MYSILVKVSNGNMAYHTNEDGSVFRGDEEAVKAKLAELSATYPLGKLVVVHNVTLTATFDIVDVQ
ncbi:MAG: hypothetical protein IKP60_07095 [Treponema sp.]|nr:hypothetical protein [Treponema sp.]